MKDHKTRIIGLAGPRHSGKGSVYRILNDTQGAMEYAFATPIKLAICTFLGVDIAWLEANKDNVANLHGTDWDIRKLHLDIGDCLRAHDDLVFVNRLMDRVLHRVQESQGKTLVITDVRRPPEAAAVRQMGGEIWHIRRHGTGDGPHDSHEVESYFDDLVQVADKIIVNDRDFASLYVKVMAAFGTPIAEAA
jgi:hypothetical protein